MFFIWTIELQWYQTVNYVCLINFDLRAKFVVIALFAVCAVCLSPGIDNLIRIGIKEELVFVWVFPSRDILLFRFIIP